MLHTISERWILIFELNSSTWLERQFKMFIWSNNFVPFSYFLLCKIKQCPDRVFIPLLIWKPRFHGYLLSVQLYNVFNFIHTFFFIFCLCHLITHGSPITKRIMVSQLIVSTIKLKAAQSDLWQWKCVQIRTCSPEQLWKRLWCECIML